MSNSTRVVSPVDAARRIDGLEYQAEFINAAAEQALVASIDASPWCPPQGRMKRRVQQGGPEYIYRHQAIGPVVPLPQYLQPVLDLLIQGKQGAHPIFADGVEQCIVNEYLPGQGIDAHIDGKFSEGPNPFGPVVASLSLLSPVVMRFKSTETGEKIGMWLEPRSLLVLRAEARYTWAHGITRQPNDGARYPRSRRISVTFRTMDWATIGKGYSSLSEPA